MGKRAKRKLEQGIARAVNAWNKKRFNPELELPTCPDCGQTMERDLFQKLVCGYCLGWRTNAKK
jgi:hypothetical protein